MYQKSVHQRRLDPRLRLGYQHSFVLMRPLQAAPQQPTVTTALAAAAAAAMTAAAARALHCPWPPCHWAADWQLDELPIQWRSSFSPACGAAVAVSRVHQVASQPCRAATSCGQQPALGKLPKACEHQVHVRGAAAATSQTSPLSVNEWSQTGGSLGLGVGQPGRSQLLNHMNAPAGTGGTDACVNSQVVSVCWPLRWTV